MLRTQILDFVFGVDDLVVGAGDEAVAGGKVKTKVFSVGHHIEVLVPNDGVEADDADIRRFAEQDIAADILIFSDLTFFGAAESGGHIDGGAEALDAFKLPGQAV